jgi:hypothetical protein
MSAWLGRSCHFIDFHQSCLTGKLAVMNEADNQIGAMAQMSKSVMGHVPDFFPIHRNSILHFAIR